MANDSNIIPGFFDMSEMHHQGEKLFGILTAIYNFYKNKH